MLFLARVRWYVNESYGLINEDVLASHLEQEIHRYLEA
jgi:hypothetical protein